MEIALAMEVAEKQANAFSNAPADGEINYVKATASAKIFQAEKAMFPLW